MLLFPSLQGSDLRLAEILWYLELKNRFVYAFVNFRLEELYLYNVSVRRFRLSFHSYNFCRKVQFLINPKIY